MDAARSPLLTDLYQLNMLQGYLEYGMTGTAVFEPAAASAELDIISSRNGRPIPMEPSPRSIVRRLSGEDFMGGYLDRLYHRHVRYARENSSRGNCHPELAEGSRARLLAVVASGVLSVE